MIIVTAIVTGIAVLLAGNLPWAGFGRIAGLAALNFSHWTSVPWALLPMTAYLWIYWRVIGGRWGFDAGRAYLRANPLTTRVWAAALAAGSLGFVCLLVLLALAARLVVLPDSAPITTPEGMPLLTGVLLLAMQSVVAGVSEEAAFRGYMQSMIEREHGVVLAILINGTFFGLLHFGNHPRDVLLMLPYYIAVSAVYGGLTWAADSILPAVVLHSVGDIVVLTRWWLTGIPEWQLSRTPPASVWTHGADAVFIMLTVASTVLVASTLAAYRAVHRLRLGSPPFERAGLDSHRSED